METPPPDHRLTTVELLIIDDFALQPRTPAQATGFCEVITERHRKASAVVTSDRDASKWPPPMTGPLLAQSAIGRLPGSGPSLARAPPSWRASPPGPAQTAQASP